MTDISHDNFRLVKINTKNIIMTENFWSINMYDKYTLFVPYVGS